jgi:hypothetical protein
VKEYGGVEVYLHAFLTSALRGGVFKLLSEFTSNSRDEFSARLTKGADVVATL